MKYCKKCGEANLNSAQKCVECGSVEFAYKCERCGTEFENMEKCPQCGLKAGARKTVCPNCGEEYYSRACPNCGYVKDADDTQVKRTQQEENHTGKKTNVLGLIGMILGIVGLVFGFLGFGYILGIPAMILGVLGIAFAKKKQMGKGLAIAAVVLGGVSLLISIISMTACKAVSDSLNETNYTYNTVGESSDSDSSLTTGAKKVDYPETVLVDNEYCKFVITGIDPSNLGSYTLKATIQNRTDKDIMFSVRNAVVNGYMIDPFWADTVMAGMTANEKIGFSNNSIQKIGTSEVSRIEFEFVGYDSNEWTDNFVDEKITIYPMGEGSAKEYPRDEKSSDIVLFDNDKCKMVIYEIGHEALSGYTLYVYLENKTPDKEIMFSVSDAAINGIMMNPFWATAVTAGNKEYSSISWFDSTLEENGITDIKDITLHLRAHDDNDFMADAFVDDNFKVTP